MADRLKICVLGAGGTGGHLAVKLAVAGHDVSVVARGAHLDAIKSNGLTLRAGEQEHNVRVRASADSADFGVQDFVLVTVKATGLAAIAGSLAPLVNADTLVAFPQNGMNWWYPQGLPADRPAPPDIPIFQLGNIFLKILRAEQIVGGSIYSGNEVVAPGIVRTSSPERNGMTLGAILPGGARGLDRLQAALEESQFVSPAVEDIRMTLWSKLMVNMCGSTIALATENRSSICRTDAALSDIYLRVMEEGKTIARLHGYDLDAVLNPQDMRKRLFDHKPSLLQDYEQRRPMELAEIVEAPIAFARAANIDTPILDTLGAIVIRRARDRGLF